MIDEAQFWHFRPAVLQLVLRQNLIGCEIGVDKGINSYNILNSLNIEKLYLIDPYYPQSEEFNEDKERFYIAGDILRPAYEQARNILNKFEDKIEWIIKPTEEVDEIADFSLDFVYIDGDHSYESVLKDISWAIDKVKDKGIIGGHDFHEDHTGVIKAVLDTFGRNRIYTINRDWWIIQNVTQI